MKKFLYLLSVASVLLLGVASLAAVCKHNVDGNHLRKVLGKKGQKKLMCFNKPKEMYNPAMSKRMYKDDNCILCGCLSSDHTK